MLPLLIYAWKKVVHVLQNLAGAAAAGKAAQPCTCFCSRKVLLLLLLLGALRFSQRRSASCGKKFTGYLTL